MTDLKGSGKVRNETEGGKNGVMNPEDYGPSVMDWRGLNPKGPLSSGIRQEGIDGKNRAYYNLRKRYGKDIARLVVRYWNHYHLSFPSSADEALNYFLGVE